MVISVYTLVIYTGPIGLQFVVFRYFVAIFTFSVGFASFFDDLCRTSYLHNIRRPIISIFSTISLHQISRMC